MGRKSVAILDVRSSQLNVVVGERGVNNTFVFKTIKTEDHSGYNGGAFFDEKELADVCVRAISAAEKVCGERIRNLYVGVPGEFTDVDLKEKEISFPKKRRISDRDIASLFDSGREDRKGYRFMRASCAIYITADNRRVVDPVGLASTSLSGILSYFYCTEYFAQVMEKIFGGMKISLRFLPTQLAMARYLIPSETRDEYALLLDVGDLSSTIMILQGSGVLAQSTYPVGRAQITANLLEKFDLPYDAALSLLSRTNLYARSSGEKTEFYFRNAGYEIDSDLLVETVKEGLDAICEVASGFLEELAAKELDYKPLYITGEGICDIRGALEHVSKRVNRVCEYLAPDLPYYDDPSMSSYIALTDMACADRDGRGFFNHLFGG